MLKLTLIAAAFVLVLGCSSEQGSTPLPDPYAFVPPPACEKKLVSLKLNAASLRSIADVLREVSGCNIIVDYEIDAPVTADLREAPWHTVLSAAAAQNGLALSAEQDVIRISRTAAAPHPQFSGRLISITATAADFRSIISVLSSVSARSIKLPDGALPPVTLKLDKVPWDQALYLLAESHNFRVEIEERAFSIVR